MGKAFDFFKQLDSETQQTLTRYTNRLLGLEDTIILATPDYMEASESILSPMLAALQKRYEFGEHRQEWADVERAAETLRVALMKADQAEQE
jgi:hypothetical protein